MKRKSYLSSTLAILASIMLTFSACGSEENSKKESSSLNDSSTTTTTTVTTTPPVTTTTTTTTTAPPPPVDVSEVLDATEYDGVYTIDAEDFGLDTEKYYVGRTELYDSKILMTVNDDELNTYLALYDILSQKMLFNLKLQNGVDCMGFTSEGEIFCKDYAEEPNSSVLCFYDYDGNVTRTFDRLPSYSMSYCDEDNNVWININDSFIKISSDGTREDYTIDRLNNNYATLITIEDDVLYFGERNDRYEVFTYDTDSGRYHTSFEYTGYNFTEGSLYNYDFYTDDKTFEFSTDLENFYTIEFDSDMYAYHYVSNEYIIIDFSTFIRILDTENSVYSDIQLINPNGDFSFYEMSLSDDTMILTVSTELDTDLYYVDFEKLNYEKAVIAEADIGLDAQTLKNIERAEEISEKYGVTINPIPYKKGEDIDDGGSYVALDDITPERMSEVLEYLDQELADYPDELFTSITKDNIYEFRFCFSRGIVSSGAANTISSASALTLDDGNILSIAFNESTLYDFDNTLVHEFMHIIEYAIEEDHPDVKPFSDWSTLNPSDFSYDAGYSDSYFDDIDYVYVYAPIDNTWFVEPYSKTRPMEDRATLFVVMITPGELDVFDSPHIIKKAECISDTLKEYYPEWYDDGEPIWHNYKYN